MRKQQTDLRPSLREICILIFGVIIPLENRKPNTAQKRNIEKLPHGKTFLKYFKPPRGDWHRPPLVVVNEKCPDKKWIKLVIDRYSLSTNRRPKRTKWEDSPLRKEDYCISVNDIVPYSPPTNIDRIKLFYLN